MTWLSQLLFCTMRNSRARALRNSCSASSAVGVLPLIGGLGEKPIGNTLRPLITSTLSELTVTTEFDCPREENEEAQSRTKPSPREIVARFNCEGQRSTDLS